ncbi:hypothetical protein [Algibacter aquimarinus]|uniref:Uncharacterized protein n=1 Tax=Algibacter aquimarinus TaxID=1136748 RepID=A0ABP9HAT2_9FLAO
MHDKFIPIKEVTLKNNCPECFNTQGLRLTFKQRFIETQFYKSITADIKQEINCNICHSIIYPVQWTDDIERVVEYQKRAFTPKKTSRYLKKASWIIIGLIGLVFLAFVITVIYPKL